MNFEITREQTEKLKGFAILTVCFSHCADLGLLPLHRDMWAMLCQIGMALFVFLSGYGVWKSFVKSGLENYFERKIDRIYIPFLFVQVVEFIAISIIFKQRFTVNDYFSAFLLGKGATLFDASMWYILYQFMWYLTFYLCARCFKNEKAILVALFVLSIVYIVFANTYFEHCSYLSLQFPFGIFFAMISEKIKKSEKSLPYIYI